MLLLLFTVHQYTMIPISICMAETKYLKNQIGFYLNVNLLTLFLTYSLKKTIYFCAIFKFFSWFFRLLREVSRQSLVNTHVRVQQNMRLYGAKYCIDTISSRVYVTGRCRIFPKIHTNTWHVVTSHTTRTYTHARVMNEATFFTLYTIRRR